MIDAATLTAKQLNGNSLLDVYVLFPRKLAQTDEIYTNKKRR